MNALVLKRTKAKVLKKLAAGELTGRGLETATGMGWSSSLKPAVLTLQAEGKVTSRRAGKGGGMVWRLASSILDKAGVSAAPLPSGGGRPPPASAVAKATNGVHPPPPPWAHFVLGPKAEGGNELDVRSQAATRGASVDVVETTTGPVFVLTWPDGHVESWSQQQVPPPAPVQETDKTPTPTPWTRRYFCDGPARLKAVLAMRDEPLDWSPPPTKDPYERIATRTAEVIRRYRKYWPESLRHLDPVTAPFAALPDWPWPTDIRCLRLPRGLPGCCGWCQGPRDLVREARGRPCIACEDAANRVKDWVAEERKRHERMAKRAAAESERLRLAAEEAKDRAAARAEAHPQHQESR